MSTLNVANISDDQSTLSNSANPIDKLNNTTTVDTKFVTNGCTKAWVSWSNIGPNYEINGSLNASSITYTRVGDVEANFTNVMADANFSVPTASSANSLTSVDGRTTDKFRARTLILDWANSTQQYADLPDMQTAVHGELA